MQSNYSDHHGHDEWLKGRRAQLMQVVDVITALAAELGYEITVRVLRPIEVLDEDAA